MSKEGRPDDEVGQQRADDWRGGLVGLAGSRGERGLVDFWIERRGCVEGIGAISMSGVPVPVPARLGPGAPSQGTTALDRQKGHHWSEGDFLFLFLSRWVPQQGPSYDARLQMDQSQADQPITCDRAAQTGKRSPSCRTARRPKSPPAPDCSCLSATPCRP